MHTHPIAQQLLEGNLRFLSAQTQQSSALSLAKLKEFAASGQTPKAVILCCSDSRAPVEMLFDQDIGDLFVIRVAGNVVAPSLVGSVEFAVSTFNTSLVVVMGHSECGAIKATLDHIEHRSSIESDNIGDIIARIQPHIASVAKEQIPYADKVAHAVELNVRASVAELAHGSQLIENLVNTGDLTILGAVLNLHTGQVAFLED